MKIYLLSFILSFYSWVTAFSQSPAIINPQGMDVATRINPPPGYHRDSLPTGSFGAFLRKFPLEKHGAKVYEYNGREKHALVHVAVLKADIGNRDLQQCADAVIRLRAEYLYSEKRYGDIHFNFTNGFRADYRKWAEGNRIRVKGNQVNWYAATTPDYSYPVFRKYLDHVFCYAGTLSLSKELKAIAYTEMQPGDVLIQGGSPGHAVLVVDMATNEAGQKVYLLAQSYMPAQSIHILKNPENSCLSPWFELKDNPVIHTPEWNFTPKDLKRFEP